MYLFMLCVFKLSVIISTSEGARILAVFPAPFHSHQAVFRPLTQELARRGHEVVVITPNPAFKDKLPPENLTEIDIQDVSYAYKENFSIQMTGEADDIYDQADKLFELFGRLFDKQINTVQVRQFLNDTRQHFDLIIAEACVRPTLIFSHIFQAPVITISSVGSLEMFTEYLGVPTHPILYPTNFHQRLHNLSFLEKAKEAYKHYLFEGILRNKEVKENEMLKRNFGRDVPLLSELKRNVAMLMINLHHVWENNRPVPPNVIYLGGLHLEKYETKGLPQELTTYLDNSVNGVIYMSLGTNVAPSMLPKDKISTILRAFSRLPYDILLKWDQNYIPGCPSNVQIVQWVPQTELLHHPKVKLFITQGGLQSTDEAIAAGVPVIGIPILGDQWYNTDQYVHLKIGLRIDFEYLREETVFEAVTTVIEDDSYRRNMLALRSQLYDQPQSSLERAVWWTEHVLRHRGASHLQTPAAHMSWTEYLEIELVLVVITFAITVFSAAVYLGFAFLGILNRYVFNRFRLKIYKRD